MEGRGEMSSSREISRHKEKGMERMWERAGMGKLGSGRETTEGDEVGCDGENRDLHTCCWVPFP